MERAINALMADEVPNDPPANRSDQDQDRDRDRTYPRSTRRLLSGSGPALMQLLRARLASRRASATGTLELGTMEEEEEDMQAQLAALEEPHMNLM